MSISEKPDAASAIRLVRNKVTPGVFELDIGARDTGNTKLGCQNLIAIKESEIRSRRVS